MNKILVTGGAGFIGSNLCKRLLKEFPNSQVICLDNLYTGSFYNIKKLLKNKNFKFIKGDITYKYLFKKKIFNDVDYIFNCACPASPIHYQHNSIKTTLVNVLGTKNLLDLATKNNAYIMQFSTSEVYGEPDCQEQSEEYRGNVNCIGIRSCYDEGKRCAESLCFDYNRMHNTKIKIIRIFNTYGPNMQFNDGRVISNFITQALKHEKFTIYGDGFQTRSFCYIDDLIDGIIKFSQTNTEIKGPINLGNPCEYSITEILYIIANKICPSNEIEFKPLPLDDPTHRKPDISKAKELLNWEPKIDIYKGLDKTIEYFKRKHYEK